MKKINKLYYSDVFSEKLPISPEQHTLTKR